MQPQVSESMLVSGGNSKTPDKNKLEFTHSKNSSVVIWPIYFSNFNPITIVTKLQLL